MRAGEMNIVQRRLLRFGYPQSMVNAAKRGSSYYRMEIGIMAIEIREKVKDQSNQSRHFRL